MSLGLVYFSLALIFSSVAFPRFGREKNFADPTASILSNFRFLRYITSFLAILSCIILPITIPWDTSVLHENDQQHILQLHSNFSNLTYTPLKVPSFVFAENCENATIATTYYFELHVLMFYIAILSCSSFIQLYFYFKLFMMSLAICVYIFCFNLQSVQGCLAKSSVLNNPFLKIELVLKMIFFVVFLHLIDRRVRV